MSAPPPSSGRRTRRLVLLGAAGAFVLLLIALATALALADWNSLRGPVARYASRVLDRRVTITGPLEMHVFSLSPRVEVHGLVVDRPAWDKPGPMLTVDELAFQLRLMPLLIGRFNFDYIRAIHPRVVLHRTADGRSNWSSERSSAARAPLKLAPIRSLTVEGGHIDVADEERHVRISTTFEASDRAEGGTAAALNLSGKGELNGRPLSFALKGDSLVAGRDAGPYDFAFTLEAGDVRATAKGRAARIFDFGEVTARLKLEGEDLADVYYLTGMALPDTPPYTLSLEFARKGMQIDLTDMVGQFGSTDMTGTLAFDLAGERPSLTGTISSKHLKLSDLEAPLGKGRTPGQGLSQLEAASGPAPPPAPPGLLLPDASLQVNRIRGMDADVRFAVSSIETERIELKKLAAHLKLTDGVLVLDPVVVNFPDGVLNISARVDGRRDMPQSVVDLRMTDVNLNQFHKPGSDPIFSGALQARAHVTGPGRSVHELATNAKGTMTLVVPHGELQAAFAELTGINVDRGLVLLLFNGKKASEIRCGVANFDIEHGTMTAQTFLIDTGSVRITGSGEVKLKTEALDLRVQGEPKKARLMRIRSPLLVQGTLAKPSVKVDIGKAGMQVGAVAALSTVLSPLAAVLALVDPGLAKNVDCAAVLAPAEATVERNRPNTARSSPPSSP